MFLNLGYVGSLKNLALREKKDKFYKERSEEQRSTYIEEIREIPRENLVDVDESGIQEFLYKMYGYALRGEKVAGGVCGSSFTRENFIAAQCGQRILAPFCFTGSCDKDLFIFWVREFLIKELTLGQTIVIDNAAFHKSQEIKKLIESADCKLVYLPPYSPDLNSIEKFWAWMKDKIRETAHLFKNLQHAIDYAFNLRHQNVI